MLQPRITINLIENHPPAPSEKKLATSRVTLALYQRSFLPLPSITTGTQQITHLLGRQGRQNVTKSQVTTHESWLMRCSNLPPTPGFSKRDLQGFCNWDSLQTRLNATTSRHVITTKRSTKILRHTENLFRNNLLLTGSVGSRLKAN